jgi:HD domain
MGTFGTKESQVDRWEDHRAAAACLRALVVAVPLPLSAAAGVFVGWTIGGDTPLDIAMRVVTAGVASVLALMVLGWLARRLLPLAVLLRLSLVFPDRAPSRFAVALRSTSVRRLREWARTNQDRLDEQALAEKVLTLASALNFHDRRTRGHSERTRALAELVVDELGLSEEEANEVRWGAFLHDIGKLLVPSTVLNKPGTPTAAEWDQLRQHPAEGGRLVRPLRPFIGSGVDAVSSHHENFDGSGYPEGLRGEEIALSARIVAVVDSFEVMTAVRSYKRSMSAAAAREELVREAGRQFDPKVVRAFVNVSLGRLHWALGLVAWAAELPFVGIIPRAAAQVGATVGAGSGAVSTSTIASVATATLGASLMVNPLAAPAPAVASAAPPGSSVTALAPSGVTATAPNLTGASATTPARSGAPSVPASQSGGGTGTTGSAPAASAGASRSGSATSNGTISDGTSHRTSAATGGSTTGTSGNAGTSATQGAPATSGTTGSGSGASGGSGTSGSAGTTPTGDAASNGAGLPVVSTVLDDVGGVVDTTLGALGKLGLVTTGKSGTSTSKGKLTKLLGL